MCQKMASIGARIRVKTVSNTGANKCEKQGSQNRSGHFHFVPIGVVLYKCTYIDMHDLPISFCRMLHLLPMQIAGTRSIRCRNHTTCA